MERCWCRPLPIDRDDGPACTVSSAPLPFTPMPTPRDGSTFLFDIGFLLPPDFYYGPANGFTPEQWGKLRAPLQLPAIPLVAGHLAATRDVEGRVEELAGHYGRVVALMQEHGKTVTESQQYFWMRPFCWSGTGFALTFGWYDTLQEARTWIRAVAGLADGAQHSDMDQGWEMIATGEEEHIVIEQRDGRQTQALVRFPRAGLVSTLEAALARAESQVAELARRLGQDFWTRRPTGGVPG